MGERLAPEKGSEAIRDGKPSSHHPRFDVDLAPAITAHPVPLQPFADQTIQIQAMASRGWRSGPDIRAVEAPVLQSVAGLFDRPRLTRGLRAGEFIAVPGQVAMDDEGQALAPGQGTEQTDVVMGRIDTVLADLGAGFQDVIKKEGGKTHHDH